MSVNETEIVYNQTPVCHIVNALNLKCAAAVRACDYKETKRLAVMFGNVMDAIKEAGYETICIATSGNVGLNGGTTQPNTILHVNTKP